MSFVMRKTLTRNLAIALSLFAAVSVAYGECADPRQSVAALEEQGIIINGPLSAEKVEKENIVVITQSGKEQKVIFGYVNNQWLRVKAHLAEGGELFSISSSEEQWKKPLSGAFRGYGAIKSGCLVEAVITSKS